MCNMNCKNGVKQTIFRSVSVHCTAATSLDNLFLSSSMSDAPAAVHNWVMTSDDGSDDVLGVADNDSGGVGGRDVRRRLLRLDCCL